MIRSESKERDVTAGADPGWNPDETASVTLEELQEFLEADYCDVGADPTFKERLRHSLWKLVLSRWYP